MSDIIAKEISEQSLGNDEGLVTLYDLTVQGVTYYFHGEDIDDVLYFQENNYYGFPMLLEGVEVTGDGAQVRPTLTLPNVNSLFKSAESADYISIDRLEDLVGGKVTRHQTLSKYVGVGEDQAPLNTNGYELPKATYIIDRVASKNRLMIQLELASPFDLAGVRVPSRQVTGKYCAWYYKGYDFSNTNVRSACTWTCKVTKYGIATVNNVTLSNLVFSGFDANTTEASFTNVPDKNLLNKGEGATFNVSFTNSGSSATVTVASGGVGYSVGSKVTLNAADFGSSDEGVSVTEGLIDATVASIETDVGGTDLLEESLFFSIDDEPFIQNAHTLIQNAPTWANNSHSKNAIVVYQGIYYMAKSNTTYANVPKEASAFWKIVRPYRVYSAVAGNNSYSSTTIDSVDPRKNMYVFHNDNIWRALKADSKVNMGAPSSTNKNFTVADICSKLLSGCKARFQNTIIDAGGPGIVPSVSTFNTEVVLPFGGFPGTRKYR